MDPTKWRCDFNDFDPWTGLRLVQERARKFEEHSIMLLVVAVTSLGAPDNTTLEEVLGSWTIIEIPSTNTMEEVPLVRRRKVVVLAKANLEDCLLSKSDSLQKGEPLDL